MRSLALAVGLLSLVCWTTATSVDAKGGYWCWTHQEGTIGSCAPAQEKCKASLEGFNETAKTYGESAATIPCKWQKSAWQLTMKPMPSPPRIFPTKNMCNSGLEKGQKCTEVK